MKVSDLKHILTKIEECYGDRTILGECSECGRTDLEIFVLSSDYEGTVMIQVGNLPRISNLSLDK